jgi:hypothetical protein
MIQVHKTINNLLHNIDNSHRSITARHEDPQTMNEPQSDTCNIMWASLGTTPLEIIYAGRLEYAGVCVFASSAG